VFIYLLEHPFFFGERIQRIIQARRVTAGMCAAEKRARGYRQIGWRMALYLEGKDKRCHE
jgi:hypothetical protein